MDIPSDGTSEEFKLALKFLNTVGVDLEEAFSFLADNHVAQVFPESIGIPSPRSKDEWNEQFRVLAITQWKVTVLDSIEGSGKVWFRLRIDSTLGSGAPMNMECMYLFRLARESQGVLKIVESTEFHDSLASTQFMVEEAKRNLKARNHGP